MSVKEQTCFTVGCDGCNATYEHDYEPHWPSADEAILEVVENADWWGDTDLLLCDRCRYKPHSVVPDGNCCARCGIDADDHEKLGESVTEAGR